MPPADIHRLIAPRSIALIGAGAWTDAAREVAGPWLALAVVLGGTINGFGMFNALMLSYTRVPYALAVEGLLPKVVARKTAAGVPWVSVAPSRPLSMR